MMGIPFGAWLIFQCFQFGNVDQLLSILAIVGIVLNFSKWKNSIFGNIVSFIFMLSPIVSRMVQVPIEMFDYLAFEIPLATFVLFYIVSISMNVIEKLSTQAISHAGTVDDNLLS